ncbi:MAG: hypothetical protein KDK70_28825, partial [Myxococcales bacterium]|nr:hypothetical protein [Myxococcales bacterium]
SAISRMYFANHLLAVIKATERFGGFEASAKGEDHGHVIHAFRRGKTRVLSDLLQSLRDRRNHADYHIELANTDCKFCRRGTVEVTPDDWQQCLAEAERCFGKLESV